jgi:hypothetical protein
MIWMTFAELLPEAREDLPMTGVLLAVGLSIVLMLGFQELLLR